MTFIFREGPRPLFNLMEFSLSVTMRNGLQECIFALFYLFWPTHQHSAQYVLNWLNILRTCYELLLIGIDTWEDTFGAPFLVVAVFIIFTHPLGRLNELLRYWDLNPARAREPSVKEEKSE